MSPAIDLQESVLSKIGGTATANGIVTLTGSVSTYMEKLAAEQAAKRVNVLAVANDTEVFISDARRRRNAEIAEAALNALKVRPTPLGDIKITVQSGWVERPSRRPEHCSSDGRFQGHT
jgi:hypothetical protein